MLDATLKVGGVLIIHNTNFNFLDLLVSDKYEVIFLPSMTNSGEVKRFNNQNIVSKRYGGTDCIYRKIKDVSDRTPGLARNIPVCDDTGRRIGVVSFSS